jgi:Fe-S-cluster containining protein
MGLDINNENRQDESGCNNDERPQYLCKCCGKCCKVVTTGYSYEELKDLADKGDEESIAFLGIFRPYPSIEAAREVLPDNVDQILNTLSETGDASTDPNFDSDKITFYYCVNLQDDNRCGIYESRPNCCKRGPAHGWSVFPPGCGFEGWQFEQREKHKKSVRMLKEYLYMVESISIDGKIPNSDMTVEEYRNFVEKKIKPLEKYGSRYW